MASRTSASVGMMVSLAVFAVLSLVLFVLTVIFAAKVQRLTNDLKTGQSQWEAAVRQDERGDRWEELKRQAGGQTGVVTYLDNSLQETMRLTTGVRRDTVDSLKQKVTQQFGADAPALMRLLQARDAEVAALKQSLAEADAAREAAHSDLQSTIDRLAKIEDEGRRTVAALNEEINGYKGELDRYREGVQATTEAMEDRVVRIRADADKTTTELQGRVSAQEQSILILEEQNNKLLGKASGNRLAPSDEGTLVDGRVVSINAPQQQVYLSIGRRNHAVLGMTFEVFNLGSKITPDEEGNYPPGKASVEIIRVDDTSSIARIIRETRGNPIIQGDIIANALYDPEKRYVFTVFGNFDTNRDSVATPQEARDIETIISSWGGITANEIAGNTDFLVLGERPVLPPDPKPDDPIELINRFINLKRSVQRYDELFDAARKTGIPVLNQNRLFTLTGLHAER